mgnify:CR=1 FL=1
MQPQPEIELSFAQLPSTSIFSLLRVHRGKKLPIIKAQCDQVIPFDTQQYNKICGFPNLEHLAFTYPQLLAAPLHYQIVMHPQFPFPAIGMVHVEQRITSFKHIPQDTNLSIVTWCDNLVQVRSGHHLSLHTEVYVTGDLYWKGESIILTKSIPGHNRAKAKKNLSAELTTYSQKKKIFVPENQGRIYAGVSKDWNLIHVHWIFAKLFGFRRAIVHGMWTLATAIAWAEEQGLHIQSCHARFLRPIFLPSNAILGSIEEGPKLARIHVLREDMKKKFLDITLDLF